MCKFNIYEKGIWIFDFGIMVRKLSLWDWSRWVCKKLLIYLMEVEMIKWLFVYRS